MARPITWPVSVLGYDRESVVRLRTGDPVTEDVDDRAVVAGGQLVAWRVHRAASLTLALGALAGCQPVAFRGVGWFGQAFLGAVMGAMLSVVLDSVGADERLRTLWIRISRSNRSSQMNRAGNQLPRRAPATEYRYVPWWKVLGAVAACIAMALVVIIGSESGAALDVISFSALVTVFVYHAVKEGRRRRSATKGVRVALLHFGVAACAAVVCVGFAVLAGWLLFGANAVR